MIKRADQIGEFVKAVNSGFDSVRADYSMSKENRFIRKRIGLAPDGGPGDYHIRHEWTFYRDIEKARDMDRNDAIVGQTIDRAVDNQIQDGFVLEVDTGDAAVDEYIQARWDDETGNPEAFDIAGEMDFHDAERYVARSILVDGDCGIAAQPFENRFQFFEAHSIQADSQSDAAEGNRVVNGVEIDGHRSRVAYHIALDDLNPYVTNALPSQRLNTHDARGVKQFMHVYHPKRSTLTRGVTAMAPIFEIGGMFEDIQFAKLVQSQIISCFVIFRNKQLGSPSSAPPSISGGVYGAQTADGTSVGSRTVENIAPGMEIEGTPGETLEGFSPDVPNPGYFEQARMILRIMGVNFGMPLMMVLLDGSDSTFHGHRAAMDEARRGFRSNQRNQAKRFHRPAFNWKVNQWLVDDYWLRRAAARSDVNVFNHVWTGPGWPYLEPVNDAQGDALQLRNGLNSPRRIQKARSRDHKTIVRETIQDNTFAIEAAINAANELNKNNPGIAVSWRDLISMPAPEGATITQSIQEPPPEQSNGESE